LRGGGERKRDPKRENGYVARTFDSVGNTGFEHQNIFGERENQTKKTQGDREGEGGWDHK